MAAVAFDTYKMVKKLRESGFTDTQAEAVTALVQEAGATDLSHVSTKDDVNRVEVLVRGEVVRLEGMIKGEVVRLESMIKGETARLEGMIKTSAAETKADILRWMFGAMAAQTALIVGLVKLIH